MKKIITSAVVIGGLTLAGAPVWFGQKAESQIRDEMTRLKNDPGTPPWLDITVDEYTRGWLSSTATTTLTVDLRRLAPPTAQPAPPPLVLSFEHDIRHGPLVNGQWLLAAIESRWQPSAEMAVTMAHYFPDQAPFSQSTVIAMAGDSRTEFRVPAFSGRDHLDTADVRWEGLTGTAQGDMQNQEWQIEIDAPLFERSAATQQLSLRSLALQGRGGKGESGMTVGDVSISLKELHMAGGKGAAVIEGLGVAISSQEHDALLAARESFAFDRVSASDGLEVGPGELVLEVRNLDAAVVADMQRQLETLQNAGITSEQMAAEMTETFKASGTALLKASPEFELAKLNLITAQGEINGRLLVGFDGTSDFDVNIPPTLIQALSVDAQASVPTVLLKMMVESQVRAQLAALEQGGQSPADAREQQVQQLTANRLAQFEAMNVIVPDGGLHRAHLNFQNGNLTLNGEPANHWLGRN